MICSFSDECTLLLMRRSLEYKMFPSRHVSSSRRISGITKCLLSTFKILTCLVCVVPRAASRSAAHWMCSRRKAVYFHGSLVVAGRRPRRQLTLFVASRPVLAASSGCMTTPASLPGLLRCRDVCGKNLQGRQALKFHTQMLQMWTYTYTHACMHSWKQLPLSNALVYAFLTECRVSWDYIFSTSASQRGFVSRFAGSAC